MSKRVENLKAKIIANIAARTPGFCESLPSLREQTQIFGESHHVVNVALKELEQEKIIRCIPYKGYKVIASFPAAGDGDAGETPPEGGVIHVLVLENLVWQIDFWCSCIQMFEKENPQLCVTPYFIADRKAAASFLEGMKDGPVVAIGFTENDGRGLPLVPRPEIARVSGQPLPVGDLLDDLIEPQDAFTVPYQIQPPILFCRKTLDIRNYDPTAGIDAFLDWTAASYGSHSLSPLNIPLLLSALGMEPIYLLPPGKMAEKLRLLFRIVRKIRDNNLYHLGLPAGVASDIKMIANGKLQCAIRGSYCAGASGYPKSADRVAILPPPEEPDGMLRQPVSRLAVIGSHCTSGAAAFFRFILGEKVQTMMMKNALGLSPFKSILDGAVRNPEAFSFNIAPIIDYAVRDHKKRLAAELPPYHEELSEKCADILIENLMLPVLTGKFDEEKQEESFSRLIERLTALMESSSKQMRDRDLREYFLRF